MRSGSFLLLLAAAMAATPYGTIEKVYSKDGLERFYTDQFSKAHETFKEDLGVKKDSTGFWIFGTGVSVFKTGLSDIDMGKFTSIDFNNQEIKYTLTADTLSATFDYKWRYRWFLIPINHKASCNLTVHNYHVESQYKNSEGSVTQQIRVSIPHQDGAVLTCDDSDSNHWGFDWMKKVRDQYVQDDLIPNLENAILNWFKGSDAIFKSAKETVVDDMTFKLAPKVTDV